MFQVFNSCFPSLFLSVVRTLFKFMKKFEAVLSEPCRSSLVESSEEEQPDFLPRPTDEATSKETSPIQCLNRALRETLLTWPPAGQVRAWGSARVFSRVGILCLIREPVKQQCRNVPLTPPVGCHMWKLLPRSEWCSACCFSGFCSVNTSFRVGFCSVNTSHCA